MSVFDDIQNEAKARALKKVQAAGLADSQGNPLAPNPSSDPFPDGTGPNQGAQTRSDEIEDTLKRRSYQNSLDQFKNNGD